MGEYAELAYPGRDLPQDGSYILYNYSGGFSWFLYGPDTRLQYDIAGALGNGRRWGLADGGRWCRSRTGSYVNEARWQVGPPPRALELERLTIWPFAV